LDNQLSNFAWAGQVLVYFNLLFCWQTTCLDPWPSGKWAKKVICPAGKALFSSPAPGLKSSKSQTISFHFWEAIHNSWLNSFTLLSRDPLWGFNTCSGKLEPAVCQILFASCNDYEQYLPFILFFQCGWNKTSFSYIVQCPVTNKMKKTLINTI